MLIRVLVAVQNVLLQRRLTRILDRLDLVAAVMGPAAISPRLFPRLHEGDVDIVLVENSQLPGAPGAWIAEVRELPERPEVIVFTPSEEAHSRAALLAAGCLAVLNSGLADRDIESALAAFIQRRRTESLQFFAVEPRLPRSSLQDFVSRSPAMQHFMATAQRVVGSRSSLLVLGETGAGKERLARAIHQDGPRGNGPFLAVNCGALPEALLESELFGHERGAFTGATRARRGFFELAHGGTIFLDEIAEVPLHLQVKLLRVLEDRQVQRLGSETANAMDVRIMAATNRDLEAEVAARRFRADLYYRLAVVTLTLPPLRERREDVPDLVDSYLRHFAIALGRQVNAVHPEAMAALERYDWPGNVRELINVVERAVLLTSHAEIKPSDLPRAIAGGMAPGVPLPGAATPAAGIAGSWSGRTLREAREAVSLAFEKAYLSEVLAATGGRVGEAAARAGVNTRTLYALMRRTGLRKEDFRHAANPSARDEQSS
jgi:DNA-binding NtrC family response regulator